MINRFTGATLFARTFMASQPAAWISTTRISAKGVLTTAQHTLTILGVSALVVMAVLFFRPDMAKAISDSLNPAPQVEVPAVTAPALTALMDTPAPASKAAATAAALTAEEKALLGSQKQQQWVTSWLSKRYRVAGDATNMLVSTAYLTAREIKLDPLLHVCVGDPGNGRIRPRQDQSAPERLE